MPMNFFNKKLYLFLLLFHFQFLLIAQNFEIIKVKREPHFVYFFQKGTKSDTIVKNKSDVFYYVVPDSLKPFITISTENGQLVATNNDSLVKFNFIKGIRYELIFSCQTPHSKKDSLIFKTLINGAMNYQHEFVVINIIDKRTNTRIITNNFFYKTNATN